ncbi:hypothetical protein DPMN_115000 [Dreissena polymorpha]|uniref:Uncharacterized protein n=1 Tax=Dreissena polymorpha TaxID=45954 RepID=A0A9D4KL97_DREPO|nr:hypothetical protein DPMN_115000 [Dreissena polymorpha]
MGRITSIPDYVCPRCLDQARPIDGRPLPRWSLTAHCLMLRPASAIWVKGYVLGEAANLPSSPNAALPEESLRSSYQY